MPLLHVVIQLQLEPVELVRRHNVAGVLRSGADQRAVLYLPAWADTVLLEIMPAGKALAVEKQLPAGGFFRGGKRVGFLRRRRQRTAAREQHEGERQQIVFIHGEKSCPPTRRLPCDNTWIAARFFQAR